MIWKFMPVLCLLPWLSVVNGSQGEDFRVSVIEFPSRAIDLADNGTLLLATNESSGHGRFFTRDAESLSLQEIHFPDDTYVPTGINSFGEIVGLRAVPRANSSSLLELETLGSFHRDTDGTIREFRLTNVTKTLAYDINDRGQIVGGFRRQPVEGDYGFTDVDIGFVFSSSENIQEHMDSTGAQYFSGITERGVLSGYFEEHIDAPGAYSEPEKFILTDAGRSTPPTCDALDVSGTLLDFIVNDRDQVVFSCVDNPLSNPFSQVRSFWRYEDSNQYLGSNLSIRSLNNQGLLAGTVQIDGQHYAFVANVPEPTYVSVFMFGCITWAVMRRKR